MPQLQIEGGAEIFDAADEIDIHGEIARYSFVTAERGVRDDKTVIISPVAPKDLSEFEGLLFQIDVNEEEDVVIRARCTGCGQAFIVAFSCKGRGVCPSCNGRHMAQTAAHLIAHVIPPVPVRQWVISVPKRLRGFLADRPTAVEALTKIFLDEIERSLCAAAGVTSAAPASARPRLGGISFLHRFGSALNRHVHLRDSSHRRRLRAACRASSQ